jgi:hypothetical protein
MPAAGDQLDPLLVQPVRQPQQRRRHRGVLAHLLHPPAGLGLMRYPHAHHQPGLADVDRADPLDQSHGLLGGLLHYPALILGTVEGWPPAGTMRGKG